QLRRQVAVKLPLCGKLDPRAHRRFLREAQIAAGIEHPYLCPIFNVEEATADRHSDLWRRLHDETVPSVPFLVMPFIEGEPLSNLIARQPPWHSDQAVALVYKLALALQKLHDHRVIHRDLKPANVMMRPPGEPVIMDFGLAHLLTSQ